MLVNSDGGRVDWAASGRVVFSRIKNLAGSGDLSSELYVMDRDGAGQACLTCDRPEIPHLSNDQPVWHPSGDWILFQSADPTLATAGMTAAQAKRLVQGGFGFNNNLWAMTPDGSAFYLLMRVAAGEATLHPHVSPDGSKVFWSSFAGRRLGGTGWTLKLADFDAPGGVPRLQNVQTLMPVTRDGAQVYESHDISPDNTTVLYSYSPGDPLDFEIMATNLATGETTNLTNAPGIWDEHAHFSPDGKRIAWVSSRGYPFVPSSDWQQTLRTEVWLMNRDGSDPQQVTFFNTPGQPGADGHRYIMADLSWSPDGSSLLVSRANIGPGGAAAQQVIRLDLAFS